MAGPPAARAAKLAVKYGPHAVAAAKLAGPAAKEAVATQQRRVQARRSAFDKARTVVDGSVLRVRDGQEMAWVVFSAEDPLAVYPGTTTPIPDLVAHADLAKRVTPDERDAARLRSRAGRAASRVSSRRRGRSLG